MTPELKKRARSIIEQLLELIPPTCSRPIGAPNSQARMEQDRQKEAVAQAHWLIERLRDD